MRILVLGAGPTGLGAAWRLHGLGHDRWELWEQSPGPGGLASSVVDDHGFTWDLGGHVQHSHYRTFDDLMDRALGPDGWLRHDRESWIRFGDRWVPYPFQYNIHRLPPEQTLRCLRGLLEIRDREDGAPPANFEELIRSAFGEGIAELFMIPYNEKVWAFPTAQLATSWIGDRVAMPDLSRISEAVVLNRDDVSWGPNDTFRFPLRGGTGAVWRSVASMLPPDRLHFGRGAVRIDPRRRVVTADDGAETAYDALISTVPLDLLVDMAGLDDLAPAADALRYSSVHVVGVGLHGQAPVEMERMCWMYFPTDDCPFYRATVFSNYSPHNVPDAARFWSVMTETSESPGRPVDAGTLAEATVRGMVRVGLIEDLDAVHHTWRTRIERGYPTPTLGRDQALNRLIPALEQHGIYSRGRFGAWKYEVSNQDHAMMQGVEVVNRLLHGSPELTLWFPDLVNAGHPVYGRTWLRDAPRAP